MRIATAKKLTNENSLINLLEDALSKHTVEQMLQDDVWTFFPNTPTAFNLDFTIFDAQFMNGEKLVKIVYNSFEYEMDMKLLAKLIFIEATPFDVGRPVIKKYFLMLSNLFYYFAATEGKQSFGLNDLERVYENVILYDLLISGIKKRISARNASDSILPFEKISFYFKRYGIFDFFPGITKINASTALSNVCKNSLGITAADYRKGGSFNFLGLDVGKHYIDYCGEFFEENIQLALALRDTTNKIDSIFYHAGLRGSGAHGKDVFGRTLNGHTTNEIMEFNFRTDIGANKVKKTKIDKLIQLTYESFTNNFNKNSVICAIPKLAVIDEIIAKSKLPANRFDTQEFIRSFLIASYLDDFGKPIESIFKEYAAALRSESSNFSLTFDQLNTICGEVLNRHTNTISEDRCQAYLRSYFDREDIAGLSLGVGDTKAIGGALLARLISHVESAGLTCFIAHTGWRRSEFAFPFSAIKVTKNTDILDCLYTPWRFNVIWKVPKTHGDAKVDREITSHTYCIANLLNLSNNDPQAPALFRFRGDPKKYGALTSAVGNRVQMLWSHFIRFYNTFINTVDPEVIKMRDLLRSGLDRYEACIGINKSTALHQKLTEYKAGTADLDFVMFIEKYISTDALDQIINSEHDIDRIDTKFIIGELLAGLPYPTSHAFRHMWAEAVLTRYRGDVGRYIRANFKHLDERFFARYLRDKETKVVHDIAQRLFINSVTRHHIKASVNGDGVFAGSLHRYVNKAVTFTHIVSPNDEDKLTEVLSGLIVSTKVNRWSTCFLRKGTEKRAKCSVDGIPQRQNASPRFCLGCINADITESNFNGIVLSIKNDVDVCRNDKLPSYIKTPHIEVVELALKQVKVLKSKSGGNKYDRYMSYLKETLELASTSKEADYV